MITCVRFNSVWSGSDYIKSVKITLDEAMKKDIASTPKRAIIAMYDK